MTTFSEYAESILVRGDLPSKLARPGSPLSPSPSPSRRIPAPTRDARIAISPAVKVKVPPVTGMADPHQRARILHALANHELQAAELFAWAILAFPETPPAFQRGLVTILNEEQFHMELYLERLSSLGHQFGDFPITGHFWHRIGDCQTPLDFISTMGLTFENANLDFAGEYIRAARAAGDEATALALEQVHRDEIRHVAFAWRWLQRWKQPDESAWDTYTKSIKPPLNPGRARGRTMDRQSREAAGLDAQFIDNLDGQVALRPGGAPR